MAGGAIHQTQTASVPASNGGPIHQTATVSIPASAGGPIHQTIAEEDLVTDVVPRVQDLTTGRWRPLEVGDSWRNRDGTEAIRGQKNLHIETFVVTDESTPDTVTIGEDIVISYDPSSREEVLISGTIPEDALGSSVTLKAKMSMSTANAGTVVVATTLASEGAAFGGEQDDTIDPNDGANVIETVSIRLMTLSAGERFQLKVAREAADGSDTHTGEWQVFEYLIEYTSNLSGD